MPIYHDFECAVHGVFEGTHPICPAFDCDNSDVKKVFLKAPGVLSDSTKKFDKGIRKTAEDYGLNNLKSAKEGESARFREQGPDVIWGNQAIQQATGSSIEQYAASANRPITRNVTENGVSKQVTEQIPDGMRAMSGAGMTKSPLPKAQITVHANEQRDRNKVKSS